jgi:hypothetical protein
MTEEEILQFFFSVSETIPILPVFYDTKHYLVLNIFYDCTDKNMAVVLFPEN